MTCTRRQSARLLHPQLAALRRERLSSGVRPLHELSVDEARASDAETIGAGPFEPIDHVVARTIPGPAGELEIRLYRPAGEELLPVLVYFFGGGWVLGSIEACEPVCRRLATGTPCAVLAVGYRRAPEHPFPAAVEDCYAATAWIAANAAELGLDSMRVAVGGGSAGANLAVAVARLALERNGPPLVFQLLVYPPTDYRADTLSSRENDDPVFFDAKSMAWCWSHYLARESDGNDPLASPLRASDLRGLPPALLITAELDPLRDEGEHFAERLSAAGVPTDLVRYDGMVHGFFSMTGVVDAAADAQTRAAATLARVFAT